MIKLKRATAANWAAANPVLPYGQPGYDRTNNLLKIGDGATAWNSLDAIGRGAGVDHGLLSGLADDDHPQYHNDTRGDARYYTKTQLNAGQLDTRYYTEAEIDALMSGGGNPAYVEKTTTYTITTGDYTINCTSGTFTVTLPTAVGNSGKLFVIKNSGNGVITVEGNGAETIDGGLFAELSTQYESITVQSTGANWIII